MGRFLAAGANHRFEIRAVLVAVNTVPTERLTLRRTAGNAKTCFLAGKLVQTIVVASPAKRSFPPENCVCLDFLRNGGWILAQSFCNGHFSM